MTSIGWTRSSRLLALGHAASSGRERWLAAQSCLVANSRSASARASARLASSLTRPGPAGLSAPALGIDRRSCSAGPRQRPGVRVDVGRWNLAGVNLLLPDRVVPGDGVTRRLQLGLDLGPFVGSDRVLVHVSIYDRITGLSSWVRHHPHLLVSAPRAGMLCPFRQCSQRRWPTSGRGTVGGRLRVTSPLGCGGGQPHTRGTYRPC